MTTEIPSPAAEAEALDTPPSAPPEIESSIERIRRIAAEKEAAKAAEVAEAERLANAEKEAREAAIAEASANLEKANEQIANVQEDVDEAQGILASFDEPDPELEQALHELKTQQEGLQVKAKDLQRTLDELLDPSIREAREAAEAAAAAEATKRAEEAERQVRIEKAKREREEEAAAAAEATKRAEEARRQYDEEQQREIARRKKEATEERLRAEAAEQEREDRLKREARELDEMMKKNEKFEETAIRDAKKELQTYADGLDTRPHFLNKIYDAKRKLDELVTERQQALDAYKRLGFVKKLFAKKPDLERFNAREGGIRVELKQDIDKAIQQLEDRIKGIVAKQAQIGKSDVRIELEKNRRITEKLFSFPSAKRQVLESRGWEALERIRNITQGQIDGLNTLRSSIE